MVSSNGTFTGYTVPVVAMELYALDIKVHDAVRGPVFIHGTVKEFSLVSESHVQW